MAYRKLSQAGCRPHSIRRTTNRAVFATLCAALVLPLLTANSLADEEAKTGLRIATPIASGFQDVDQRIGKLFDGYASALAALELQHDADVAELQKNYLATLDRVGKSYQDAGSADGALAVRNEKKRIQVGTAITEPLDNKNLGKLHMQQSRYQQALQELVATRDAEIIATNAKMTKALEDFQRALTRAGALDRVAAVENVLKSVPSPPKKAPAFDPGKRPETPEELAQFLTGTKWSWEGGKPSSAVFFPDQQYEVTNNATGRRYGRYTYTINDKLEVSTPYGGPGHSMKIVFNGNFRSFKVYNEPEHKQSREGKFLSRDEEKTE